MEIEVAKRELIDWLNQVDNEEMVAELLCYKKNHEAQQHKIDLTPEQLAKVYKGLEDVKAGRVVESKELWKKYGR